MRILFYSPDIHLHASWMHELQTALPHAQIRLWQEGDDAPADYAAVWKPCPGILGQREGLQAIFNLGAGVDALLALEDLPAGIPVIRIDDGGMAIQMAEYVTYAALQHFRQFDVYAQQAQQSLWKKHAARNKKECRVGMLGIGALGTRIVEALQHFDFPVASWSRTKKEIPGVEAHAGPEALTSFLNRTNILVCALPLTPETNNILNHATLSQLPKGAYLINIARGQHIVDADLLALIASGHIAGATIDAFREEPLPDNHPFWKEPRIHITPHISAMTMRAEAAQQIADKITALAAGQSVSGIVDRDQGY